MALVDSFAVAAAPAEAQGEREGRAAIAIAASLYLVGAMLTATAALLPHVGSPAGVVAVGLDALLTAALLFFAASHGWGGLRLACAADLWGVALIAVLHVLLVRARGVVPPFAVAEEAETAGRGGDLEAPVEGSRS